MTRKTIDKESQNMGIFYRIVVICFVFLITSQIQGIAAAPVEVQVAAEEGLTEFLVNIPPSELSNMGLPSPEDIKIAILGKPYEQFTIYPRALEGYQPGQSVSSLLTNTDNWVYPVMVNGKARTQLNVIKSKGQWKAGYFGGTLPARIQEGLSFISTLYGSDTSFGISSSNINDAKLIRIYQVNADFLFVENDVAEYLFPIDRGRSQVLFGADKLYSAMEVIPLLNIKVAESIMQWNENRGQ